jgi:hypothetical protein
MPMKDLIPAHPPLTPFEELIDKHLPLAWRQADERRRQIRLVIAIFLLLPESKATKERRQQAQEIVTVLCPNVKDIQTIQQKCHQDTFEAEVTDSNQYYREFDTRLAVIGDAYEGELIQPT